MNPHDHAHENAEYSEYYVSHKSAKDLENYDVDGEIVEEDESGVLVRIPHTEENISIEPHVDGSNHLLFHAEWVGDEERS